MTKWKPPTVRGAYSYDPAENSDTDTVQDWPPSMTQQSQAEEADINTIVRRFGLTGQLPENIRTPTYADFEDVVDFHTAQNAIVRARESFMLVPPEIRIRFQNDPQNFVEYCSDPKNVDQLREWGMATGKAPEAPKAHTDGIPAPGTAGAAKKDPRPSENDLPVVDR